MRTTLDIDEDVLFAAKELAAKEKKTAGKVLSEFFRRGLHDSAHEARQPKAHAGKPVLKNGVPILPSRGEIVTTDTVRRIMEEEGI